MTYERAKEFADRLPPIVPKEETDLSHLDEEMRELLYPSREPKPFRMGVVFDDFEAAESGRAMELAKSASAYRAFRDGSRTRHRAEFETREANRLRDLVSLVGNRRGTDVLVGGKKAPYGRELWLPLFYLFVTGD